MGRRDRSGLLLSINEAERVAVASQGIDGDGVTGDEEGHRNGDICLSGGSLGE